MAPLFDAPRSPRSPRGFTLIEIVVVLFILGVVIAMAAAVTTALTSSQRLTTTTTRMAAVDNAIVQFVMQTKRLPCPANGTLDSTSASAGVEPLPDAVTGCPSETNGVVPWRTLGLSENDATDGWNHRFTYRVQATLAATSALDMSWCDPAGTGALVGGVCNSACTSSAPGNCTPPATYLQNKGLQIRNVAGTIIMNPAASPYTGAAYVVISAGSSGGGAYTSSGQLSATTTVDGTEEAKNYANLAILGYYVDDSISDVAGAASHFDDLVSRPSLLSVINKAGLGPRAHT
jgi:prepilin-type N-terminal cleavage/methylation domain-containing protein